MSTSSSGSSGIHHEGEEISDELSELIEEVGDGDLELKTQYSGASPEDVHCPNEGALAADAAFVEIMHNGDDLAIGLWPLRSDVMEDEQGEGPRMWFMRESGECPYPDRRSVHLYYNESVDIEQAAVARGYGRATALLEFTGECDEDSSITDHYPLISLQAFASELMERAARLWVEDESKTGNAGFSCHAQVRGNLRGAAIFNVTWQVEHLFRHALPDPGNLLADPAHDQPWEQAYYAWAVVVPGSTGFGTGVDMVTEDAPGLEVSFALDESHHLD
jgi:hypothetical protein